MRLSWLISASDGGDASPSVARTSSRETFFAWGEGDVSAAAGPFFFWIDSKVWMMPSEGMSSSLLREG
jgi:hypothetical protein